MSRTRRQVTIVGGGIAGLTAAIACAEEGVSVRLLEAHEQLGGRARNSEGPYRANLGPHAMWSDGDFWSWMRERKILPPHCNPRLSGARMRLEGTLRRGVPMEAILPTLRLRGREAPVDLDFRTWATRHAGERVAAILASASGVHTYHHDPGELSAAFVWPRTVRIVLHLPTVVRYPVGGWSALVESLEKRVRELGVSVETGSPVDALPEPPVILATELSQVRALLGDDTLSWSSGKSLCIDLGLSYRRGDPTVVSDLDEAGWIGRYSATNPSIAPDGEELVQAQMPIRPGESADLAAGRLERLLDIGLAKRRERETWRRRQVMDGRTGALDMPGFSWQDRPAIDRGEGVFIAGDMVAAPGLLAEVSWASAIEASRLAVKAAGVREPAQPAGMPAARQRLRSVA
ncbi:MAG TPA: FAD-dependent oxidoreductase [Solirubrobacteraceae bacterium]|jgi:hypothetical protein